MTHVPEVAYVGLQAPRCEQLRRMNNAAFLTDLPPTLGGGTITTASGTTTPSINAGEILLDHAKKAEESKTFQWENFWLPVIKHLT